MSAKRKLLRSRRRGYADVVTALVEKALATASGWQQDAAPPLLTPFESTHPNRAHHWHWHSDGTAINPVLERAMRDALSGMEANVAERRTER